MNKVILMGRLTNNPEVRYSSNDKTLMIVRFTIAINRYSKKENTKANFINCVAFGKTGAFIDKFFKKGKMIAITGRLNTGSYDKDGIRHYTTEIIVEEVYFTESKSSSESNEISNEQDSTINNKEFNNVEENNDDIPF